MHSPRPNAPNSAHDDWRSRAHCAVSLELLRRNLPRGVAKRALVLGPETSSLREQLAPLCEELTCLEGDALKELQDRESLPFEEESFDLICALDTLSEAHDDEAMISELRRALAPGGLLLLAVPAHPWLYTNHASAPIRRYTRRTLAKRLLDSGLTPERNTYANSLLFALSAPAALATRLVDVPKGQPRQIPKLANELCYRAFAAERFVSRHVDLPIGETLVALARRTESTAWLLPKPSKSRLLPRVVSAQPACY